MLQITLNDETRTAAKCLLIAAGIGPTNLESSEPGDQYGIESFGVDVDGIVIVNDGVAHRLIVTRRAGIRRRNT
jgi:hypothetical protein